MRRRAASHKPRRMPVALKSKEAGRSTHGRGGGGNKKHEAEGEDKESRRCRKHRRRPRALLAMHSPHAVLEDHQQSDGNQEGEGEGVCGGRDQGPAEGKRSPPRSALVSLPRTD